MHGGIEWLVDGHGCSPARLRSRAAVIGVLAVLAVLAAIVTAHARGRAP